MIDKVGIKTAPKTAISIRIEITPTDILTHQIGTVERAMRLFTELGLVEILTDGRYYMTDIQLSIGLSSTEGERKRLAKQRLQTQNLLPQGMVETAILQSNAVLLYLAKKAYALYLPLQTRIACRRGTGTKRTATATCSFHLGFNFLIKGMTDPPTDILWQQILCVPFCICLLIFMGNGKYAASSIGTQCIADNEDKYSSLIKPL